MSTGRGTKGGRRISYTKRFFPLIRSVGPLGRTDYPDRRTHTLVTSPCPGIRTDLRDDGTELDQNRKLNLKRSLPLDSTRGRSAPPFVVHRDRIVSGRVRVLVRAFGTLPRTRLSSWVRNHDEPQRPGGGPPPRHWTWARPPSLPSISPSVSVSSPLHETRSCLGPVHLPRPTAVMDLGQERFGDGDRKVGLEAMSLMVTRRSLWTVI